MSVANFEESFIYKAFTKYYEEILRQKQKALLKAGPQVKAISVTDVRRLVEDIITSLEKVLKQQEENILETGSYGQKNYKAAEYIMVALTDEVFLNLNWHGQDQWDKNILESRIYNTRKAGENFFKTLVDFLEQNDPLRKDMAAIYLQTIALGFQGKYRNTANLSELDGLIEKLYEFIYQHSPKVFTHNYDLFPDAAGFTIEEANAQKLPNPYRWYFYFLGFVLLYLFLSYALWFDATYEVEKDIFDLIGLVRQR